MKKFFILSLVSLLTLAATSDVSATLIWSEDFSAYADGASVDGSATAVGAGTLDTNGTAAIASGRLLVTADGGRDALQVDTTDTTVLRGFFTADIQRTAAGANNSLFTQLTEGGRSTGGTPVQGFTPPQNGTDFDAGPVTVTMYFNASGSAYSYTAPDASTASIAAGTYDYWVGTTLDTDDGTSTSNGTAVPDDAIMTMVLQTFAGQSGNVYAYDNLSLNSIPVPEPSSWMLIGLSLLGISVRRRK